MNTLQVGWFLAMGTGILVAGLCAWVRPECRSPADRRTFSLFIAWGAYLAAASGLTAFGMIQGLWRSVLWAPLAVLTIWAAATRKRS